MPFARAWLAAMTPILAVLTGCNAPGVDLAGVLGIGGVQARTLNYPLKPNFKSVLNPGCASSDPDHLCLASRWVPFLDDQGEPVISRDEAQVALVGVNAVWKSCNLSFVLENYAPVNPTQSELRYSIADYRELKEIRQQFGAEDSILITLTGPWDREGSLGNTGANAWTTLPGAGPYGAVLEKPVAKNANLIAHELGHYMNLGHVNNSDALMNSIIYRKSTALHADQCATARSAARYFWAKAIR